MNIGIFTDTYYPEANGVANSAYQLKNALEKRGHNVYVFTVTNPEMTEAEHNVFRFRSVPFVFLKERRVSTSLALLWIEKVRGLHLDLIHTQTEFFVGHLGRKIAKYLDIPMVHTYHTIYEDYTHYIKVPGNAQLKNLVKPFSRYCCNRAQKVIVPTEKVQNLLQEYGVERNIIVQPTGVDFTKFLNTNQEKIEEIRNRYHLKKEHHVMVSVGRLSEEKNLGEIISYLPEIIKRDNMARLLIVGDGPDRENLEEAVSVLQIEKYVIFTGMADWSEIQNFYGAGDVFVCASTSETQGLTYIEALASKKPILVRKDECLEGVLQEGVNGYCYETKGEFIDKYMEMFQDNKCQKLSALTRASIADFSVETFAANVEKIYESVLDGVEAEQEAEHVEKDHQLVG